MVARSFKKCGISNAMDGTEDEILWEETEDVSTTPVDNEDEDEGVYADHLTPEEWQTCLPTAMMKILLALSEQGLCLL